MSLYVWGKNNHGQLGLKPAPLQPSAPPSRGLNDEDDQVEMPALKMLKVAKARQEQKPTRAEYEDESFVAVAAGEHHTLAVTQYGDVCSFGRGKEGQLGNGEASRLGEHTPRKVESLSNETVVSVACGAFHSLAITSSGRLYEWGLIHTEPSSWAKASSDAELLALAGPSRSNVTRHGTYLHSVVADSARRWLSATDNDRADGDISDDEEPDEEKVLMQSTMLRRLPFRRREALPRLARSLLGMCVVSVSAGYAHSVAVTKEGRAFATGQNDRGQLGLGHRIHTGVFREVMGMEGRCILEVACGEQHNVARALPMGTSPASDDANAELYVWGGGRLGQLGLGEASTRLAPTRNSFLSDTGGGVVSVAAGANHSVCVVASGRVFGWGHAEYNQQGVAVVAGADLMGDHDVHGYFRIPRMVRGLMSTDVVSVCCGSNFTLAVDRDGLAHSFGWNEGDALGRGWLGAYDPSPGPVPSLPPVIAISAGSRHAVAVTAVGPALGRHLSSLVDDTESADVELLAPDAGRRGETVGIPVHVCLISVRCPYLAGHVEAALTNKNNLDGSNNINHGRAGRNNSGDRPVAELCLEYATVETVRLLVRYLYTDELPAEGVSGEALGTLGGLAKELMLPRLEGLCVKRLPYSLRRLYNLQNDGIMNGASSTAAVPESTFVGELGGLAGSMRHCDLTLVVPEWKWELRCHKAILCSAPWWRALLMGGFREGGGDSTDMSGVLQEGVSRPEALEAAIRPTELLFGKFSPAEDSVRVLAQKDGGRVVLLLKRDQLISRDDKFRVSTSTTPAADDIGKN